jgi:serine/threonine-protein kinase
MRDRIRDIVVKIRSVRLWTDEPTAITEESPQPIDGPRDSRGEAPEAWGRYRLIEKVGEGGFGSVYRAWDSELERELAVKILHPRVANAQLRSRLLLEGRALARVRHPNVVSVLGVESHGDRVGLCMEFVHGETLTSVLGRHGTLNAREAALIGEDVCRALAAVHRAGFVHRDVKAGNVIREDAGRIVLMDFGTGQQLAPLERSGHFDIAGTPVYMAPEVLAGEPASARSDVYSVGVLLYHLVTLEYPVEGRTLEDLCDAHEQGRRRLLSERRPGLPVAFIRVTARALAPEPEQRYATAGALLEALGTISGLAQPRTVTQNILSVAAIFSAAAIGTILLGFINSTHFNVALERSDVALESPVDWLIWGLRSLIGPVINLAQVFVLALVLAVIVRAIRRLWPTADHVARRIGGSVASARIRVGYDDPYTFGQLVFAVAVAYFAVVCLIHFPLISALVVPISALTPEQRFLLSPDNVGQHLAYRSALDFLVVGLGLALYRVIRLRGRHASRPGSAYAVAVGAMLILSTYMWGAPYRVLFQSERPLVELDGQRCYDLGSNQHQTMIYCPEGAPPQVRRVPLNDPRIRDSGITESIYATR